jgi:hypothetical protein
MSGEEKDLLLKNEFNHNDRSTYKMDTSTSAVVLHLEESAQTEAPNNNKDVNKTSGARANNGMVYCLIAICLVVLLVPIIIILERRSDTTTTSH